MTDRALHLLTDLVALPTVNPMGRPYRGVVPVERPAIEYLERLFAPYGVKMERQLCSPIHESLLITVPGQVDGPALVFESHLDVVPADDWVDRAFLPHVEGSVVFGRGACDDKGCLVAMVLAVLDLLEAGEPPYHPLLFLAAGDEEYAQSGIRRFVQTCPTPLGWGVFGEPTQSVPVIQHKGTARWDITAYGRSAHSSRPELGRNAILDMLEVVRALESYQEEIRRRHVSPLMTGPSLTVTMIQGGRTRNAVPDQCTISVDFRVLPGMDPVREREAAICALDTLGLDLAHSEVQLCTPPLSTDPHHPFCQGVLEICQGQLGRDVALQGVPYGTDAAWMPPGVPSLVLGPGNIETAHAVDERVDVAEVVECAHIYRRIMLRDWAGAVGV